jgi:hypothetical protein
MGTVFESRYYSIQESLMLFEHGKCLVQILMSADYLNYCNVLVSRLFSTIHLQDLFRRAGTGIISPL